MTAHKHALLMAMYAQDALTTDKPHLLWEYRSPYERRAGWSRCVTAPIWVESREYRRKPQTRMVNGFEVEAPVVCIDPNISYFMADPTACAWHLILRGSSIATWRKGRGLFFSTREAAIANAKAMAGINPHTSCQCKD